MTSNVAVSTRIWWEALEAGDFKVRVCKTILGQAVF